MWFWTRYRRLAALAAILLFSLLLLTLQVGGVKNLTRKIEQSLFYLLSPLERLTHGGKEKLSGVSRYFQRVKQLETEKRRLEEENRRLQEKLLELEETRLENRRLNRLLDFKQEKPRQYLAAEVIGRDPTNWFKSLTLDKGSADGLNRNLPVLTSGGLVGRIVETTPSSAKVLTINDTASKVGALVQSSRSLGVVVGDAGGQLIMKYVESQEAVAVGDLVVTSGMGGVFPKGLLIGKVKWVKKKPHLLFQEIELTPAVDFNHIEEVLILRSPRYAVED